MKQILILAALMLFSSFTDGVKPKKGDSILDSHIRVTAEVNHSFVFYYAGHDLKFGFADKRILDCCIRIEPVFDSVYIFSSQSEGCLIWVKNKNKWAVLNLDTYQLETDFLYDKISDFKEKSVDNETHIGVYEAEAERDGARETLRIEKYLCLSYYDY